MSGDLDRGRSVADAAVLRERASATPLERVVARGPSRRAPVGVHPPRDGASAAADHRPSSLRDVQRWFAQAVMTPESADAPRGSSRVEALLTPGPARGARDRLEIYRRAYHARLIECLLDDYPVLAHALGEAAFDALCRGYVERHPSTEPNLNGFGARMPQYCDQEAPEPFAGRAFAADLASLEWAVVEVIHAQGAEPLTLAGLGAAQDLDWSSAKIVPTPAFRLLRFRYPVNAYYQAVREDGSPELPEPAPSAVVVYRSGSTIWRMDLEEAGFHLLQALASGQTLGGALDAAATGLESLGEDVAAQRVTSWFRDWVSSGLFAAVETG